MHRSHEHRYIPTGTSGRGYRTYRGQTLQCGGEYGNGQLYRHAYGQRECAGKRLRGEVFQHGDAGYCEWTLALVRGQRVYADGIGRWLSRNVGMVGWKDITWSGMASR